MPKSKIHRYWMTITALGGIAVGTWIHQKSPALESIPGNTATPARTGASSLAVNGRTPASLSSTPGAATPAKIPMAQLLKDYDQELSPAAHQLLTARLEAYSERLKAEAIAKKTWIEEGMSPEQDSVEGDPASPVAINVGRTYELTEAELRDVPKIEPGAEAVPTSQAAIAQGNEALTAAHREIAALMKAGRKSEALELEQRVLLQAGAGPAETVQPRQPDDEALYSKSEKSEFARRYIVTQLNREAASAK